MSRINLRPMVEADFALVNAWRSDPRITGFEEEFERGGQVIELDGEPVGWIEPHPAYAPAWQKLLGPSVGSTPWTLDLFVAPERWNQGIGRAAIRATSERCLDENASCMVVDVARGNPASWRAFQAAGWAVVPTDEEDVILRYPPAARGENR